MIKKTHQVNAVHFMMVAEDGGYRFLTGADNYEMARAELEKIAIQDFKEGGADTEARSYVLIDWANNFSEVFVYDFAIQINVNSYRS